MAEPLSTLSPSKQNARSPIKDTFSYESYSFTTESTLATKMTGRPASSSTEEDFHDSISSAPTSPSAASTYHVPESTTSSSRSHSPGKPSEEALSPTKSATNQIEEDYTQPNGIAQEEAIEDSVIHYDMSNGTSEPSGGRPEDETMNEIGTPSVNGDTKHSPKQEPESGEETEITLSIDDTIGDLSTFSAVANADMTRFANLRGSISPAKPDGAGDWSPSKQLRTSVVDTPSTVRRPPYQLVSRRSTDAQERDVDATPRRAYTMEAPTDLLNFTGQTNIIIPPPSAPRTTRRSPSGRGAFPIRVQPSPTVHRSQASLDREKGRGPTSPDRHSYVPATPAERKSHLGDLLDFDLEPMATPRSIPTVTPRELEALRSDMQSQISGLSATLSGKEAEVLALKRSITDAEVRCGNTSEELRNERSNREALDQEKSEWERRGREMENVLREVRQEIMIGEREREKLRKQGEDAERRAEEQEVKILELNTMLDSSRRQNSTSPLREGDAASSVAGAAGEIDAAVKDATERVARELHTLYKGKHETKVDALKKSYAARWEKQVRELQENLKSARDDMVKLQTERDATMSGVVPGQALMEEWLREKEELRADKQMLHARVKGLEEETHTMRARNEDLLRDLDRERAEKGELVSQVDLFLAIEADSPAPVEEKPVELSSPSKELRTSGGEKRQRPMSMLKAPSKFTGIPGPGKVPVGRGIPRGGIMEGIARMGAGR